MKRFAIPVLLAAMPALGSATQGENCFPKNNLHLEDRLDRKDANMTEVMFNDIITHVASFYSPIVGSHDANLVFERNWDDSTVNAYASQSGDTWNVAMFGGLARRPEVTPDGFAMVVCHELGHHLAGFPLKGERWAASEGQSDYFATQACALKIWEADVETNATFRDTAPQIVKVRCDSVYDNEARQNLCYRGAMAGKSLAELLAELGDANVPEFETPDASEVPNTVDSHPAAQCRLDTYFNGALCSNLFPDMEIPGKNHPDGQSSMGAERDAALKSCTDAAFYAMGKRPKCWYAPKLSLTLDIANVEINEISGNGNDVWEPGETFGINVPLVNNLLGPIEGATLEIREVASLREVSYPAIGAGETAMATEAFSVNSPRSRQCGDRFSLIAKVSLDEWYKENTLDFMLGRTVSEERIEDTTALPIPDNTPAGVSSVLSGTVNKLTSAVSVSIDLSHTYIGDLKIVLMAPSGSEYTVFNRTGGGSDDINETFEVVLMAQEQINADWTLKIVDGANADIGTLNSWAVDFTSVVCEGGVQLVGSK